MARSMSGSFFPHVTSQRACFQELRPSQAEATELPAAIGMPSLKPILLPPAPPSPPHSAPLKPPPKAMPRPLPKSMQKVAHVRIQPVSLEAEAAQTAKSMPTRKMTGTLACTAPDTTLAPRNFLPRQTDTDFTDLQDKVLDDIPETPAPFALPGSASTIAISSCRSTRQLHLLDEQTADELDAAEAKRHCIQQRPTSKIWRM